MNEITETKETETNTILSIRMTRISLNRVKFEVLRQPLNLNEELLLKKFIREKVLTGQYDKVINIEK